MQRVWIKRTVRVQLNVRSGVSVVTSRLVMGPSPPGPKWGRPAADLVTWLGDNWSYCMQWV